MYRHVTGHVLEPEMLESHLELPGYRREPGYEDIRRVELSTLAPEARLRDQAQAVELVLDAAAASREASRCLDCGVTPVFDGTRCIQCGGCVDVCPTLCLKIVPLAALAPQPALDAGIAATLGPDADRDDHSAILKDEDRCIRCALCVHRCPADAIQMERVCFDTQWRTVQ